MLYYPSFERLPREAVLGKVRGQIPYLGYVTILAKEFKEVTAAIIVLLVIHEWWKSDSGANAIGPNSWREWIKFLIYPTL